MQIFHTKNEFDQYNVQQQHNSIGFVPTMGNIHSGHLLLVEHAQMENDYTIVSIFVNPTQFGENEDFASYPRTLDNDLTLLEKAGVDGVFIPQETLLYPPASVPMSISMPGLTDVYCGATRKGFFSGICQVVLILCNLLRPNRLYLGDKDWQQWLVVKRLFSQLHITIPVVRVPIVREADGLAMSSRNSYLSIEERAKAPLLHHTIQQTVAVIKNGVDSRSAEQKGVMQLQATGFVIDYFNVVDPLRLSLIEETQSANFLLIAAVYLGTTRLLDNSSDINITVTK